MVLAYVGLALDNTINTLECSGIVGDLGLRGARVDQYHQWKVDDLVIRGARVEQCYQYSLYHIEC